MTGVSIGVFFSLFLVLLAMVVLFFYTWLRSHDLGHMTHAHVDGMAGDEGDV